MFRNSTMQLQSQAKTTKLFWEYGAHEQTKMYTWSLGIEKKRTTYLSSILPFGRHNSNIDLKVTVKMIRVSFCFQWKESQQLRNKEMRSVTFVDRLTLEVKLGLLSPLHISAKGWGDCCSKWNMPRWHKRWWKLRTDCRQWGWRALHFQGIRTCALKVTNTAYHRARGCCHGFVPLILVL